MELVVELLQHLSLQWILTATIIFLVFDKTGFIQVWFKRRSEGQTFEREQLSEDQRDLLDRLQEQIAAEREWRINDSKYYRQQIEELRSEVNARDKLLTQRENTIRSLADAATLSERGNARLRHGLNNIFQYVAALITICKKNNLEVMPYEGWHDLLGISADLDQHLHALFSDVVKRGLQ